MKRTSLLAVSLILSIAAFAGDEITLKSGNPKVLYQTVRASLEIDYSKTMVKDETLDAYLHRRGDDFVRDWPEDTQKAQMYFVVRFNKKNKDGMQLNETPSAATHKMIIHVDYLDMGNGGSSFNPWASAKAGGVIMNGSLDIIDLSTNKLVCSMSANEVKGLGNPSETVRLGMCYFELASRMLKFAKSYKVTGSEKEIDLETEARTAVVAAPATTQGKAKVQTPNSNTKKSETMPATQVAAVETPAAPQQSAKEMVNGVPNTVLNAQSYLSTDKHGEGGSVACLRGERRVSLYLDFSEAMIVNYDEEGFIEYMSTSARGKDLDPNFATTWEKSLKKKLATTFMSKVNEELADEDQTARLTTKQGEKYTLKVIVKDINDDGDNECDYYVIETATGEVVAQYSLEVDGGHVGRLTGLLEDGFSNAGEEFGELFAKKIKKGK